MLTDAAHEPFIRQAIELAIASGKGGNLTFGAVLVYESRVVETSVNTEVTGEGFGHAEYSLVVKAAAHLPESVLIRSTLYTSCAPCARCACAIAAAGIPRVVYSVSYGEFYRLLPRPHTPPPIVEALALLGLTLGMVGPICEEEGLRAFEHWRGEYVPLEERLSWAARMREQGP